MSKLISAIPRSHIERLQIYINKDKKTLAEIKAETGADYLMNGGLYDMAHWIANCQLKAEGYVHAQDAYTYWGLWLGCRLGHCHADRPSGESEKLYLLRGADPQ